MTLAAKGVLRDTNASATYRADSGVSHRTLFELYQVVIIRPTSFVPQQDIYRDIVIPLLLLDPDLDLAMCKNQTGGVADDLYMQHQNDRVWTSTARPRTAADGISVHPAHTLILQLIE